MMKFYGFAFCKALLRKITTIKYKGGLRLIKEEVRFSENKNVLTNITVSIEGKKSFEKRFI